MLLFLQGRHKNTFLTLLFRYLDTSSHLVSPALSSSNELIGCHWQIKMDEVHFTFLRRNIQMSASRQVRFEGINISSNMKTISSDESLSYSISEDIQLSSCLCMIKHHHHFLRGSENERKRSKNCEVVWLSDP